MNNFGKNIQYLRRQKGMRQAQINDHLGFSRTTWSNYENAITEPSIDGLIKISIFFGISLDKLILSDLSEGNEKISKKGDRAKPSESRPYLAHEEFPFAFQEAGLSHIMQEIDELKKEINMLKSVKKKK